ncbi:MAG: glycosyltransferase [Kiritimatiellia bacterium]
MKILVVTMGLNPASGGPTRSCKGMCRALAQAGVDVTLLVLVGTHEFENPCGVRVLYAEDGVKARGEGKEWNVQDYDLVHTQGLWHLKLHAVCRACRKAGTPYVISPRGMLDPWALSEKKWKKRVALWLYQYKDLRCAAAFHVTAREELSHVRDAGLRQQCIVAPNAVDLPLEMPARCRCAKVKTAIFLSRLHPGKGLLSLAAAWARIRPRGWKMKVVGPDSYGHKKDVMDSLVKLGIRDDWMFADALDDVRKWEAYRSADLLVHPSVSENFGITIAEGLAAELPVITTKGTPWGIVEARKCGWWIDIGVEPLAAALQEAMSLSDEARRAMGARGRQLVEEKYTWDAAAKKMIEGYKDVINART